MADTARGSFYSVLRADRDAVVARWLRKTESAAAPASLPRAELLDHLPQFVDDIVAALNPDPAPLDSASGHAKEHGAQRLRLGFDVAEVVYEYGLLGECILETADQAGIAIDRRDQMIVWRCLTAGIANAAGQYVSQRDLELQRQASAHIGFIAHEVRNPLAAAGLAFARLRQGPLAAGGRAVDLLERNLRRTAEVVENALAQSSLKLGIEPKLQLIDTPAFLRQIADDLALESEARQIGIAISTPPSIAVKADPRLLRSALVNLVMNAIKFSHPGSTVSLSVHREDGQAIIDVADGCGGLPPGKVEELFAPLVQRSENRTGYGLGLAIARQAAEAHAGTIRLRDLPGHGCVFSVVLPSQQTAE